MQCKWKIIWGHKEKTNPCFWLKITLIYRLKFILLKKLMRGLDSFQHNQMNLWEQIIFKLALLILIEK
jgi:hypothetical protein